MSGSGPLTTKQIDKLDYRPIRRGGDRSTQEESDSPHDHQSRRNVSSGSVFERVAEALHERRRTRLTRQAIRYASLFWAVVNCLFAGSITTFSLYSPLLQRRLHYSQYQVNGISTAAEIALYLPVPLSGYFCDRYGPARPSMVAGVMSAVGYLLAAFTYRSGQDPLQETHWPFEVIVLGFILVGAAASCMYLSAVTCCVKNFGRGKHKGLALALPIAALGLSGLCLSQFGSNVLYERLTDGGKGDVDVFKYFVFLACILLGGGLVGGALLRVVDEDELNEQAVDELERSGTLDQITPLLSNDTSHGYESTDQDAAHGNQISTLQTKKQWLLTEETRLVLQDKTMWLLIVAFFLLTGPGECFMVNVGTMVGTLSPAHASGSQSTSPATHVSIIALASTVARLLSGALSDYFGPTTTTSRPGLASLSNSVATLSQLQSDIHPTRLRVSRVIFLVGFALIMTIGQVLFASGLAQDHAERFWIISSMFGTGYGAIFNLTPVIISVVWGVENFGTNWGIVAIAPAGGVAVWNVVYSVIYQAGVKDANDGLCHGLDCYASTFWAMSVSTIAACAILIYAWRGPGGWHQRGIAV